MSGELKFLGKFTKNGGRGVGEEFGRGSGWGVRVDVNEELKFLENSKKNRGGGGGSGRGSGGGWAGRGSGCM